MHVRIHVVTLVSLLWMGLTACGGGNSNNSPTNVGGKAGGSAGSGSGASTAGSNAVSAGGGGSSSQGTSGSSSSGGQMPDTPRTVKSCDELPPAGKWEKITPAGFEDSRVVMVDPFEAGVVYLSGKDKGVFKSSDCGATWEHINSGENGASLDMGSIVSGAMDPVEKGVMYAAPIYGAGGLWKSSNGGVDWEQLFPDGSDVQKTVEYNFIDSISIDPSNHKHLVAGTHGNCKAPYDPVCHVESTDSGKTWRMMKIPGEGWQEQAGPWVLSSTSWLYGAPSGLYLTEDNGANWKQLTVDGASAFGGGEVENHGMNIGKDGTLYMTSYQGVVRNKGDLNTWELIPNSGGRVVSMVIGDGKIYVSDQWSPTYHVADESDATKWEELPPPYTTPADTGGVFLDYDSEHHILYSSNFGGGAWRLVTQ